MSEIEHLQRQIDALQAMLDEMKTREYLCSGTPATLSALNVGTSGAAPGQVFANDDIKTAGGLSVGSLVTNPGAGAIVATGENRIGGGLYVGSTATAPTTGCVHIPSGSLVGTTTASMTKDTAISFTPVNNQGMILVWRRSLTVALTVWGLVYYNAGSTAFTAIASGGANLEVRTGVLSGTTGTDTKVTVSAHTDGKIYIENRVVTGLTLHYVLLGG